MPAADIQEAVVLQVVVLVGYLLALFVGTRDRRDRFQIDEARDRIPCVAADDLTSLIEKTHGSLAAGCHQTVCSNQFLPLWL
ncbi:hypothetical protein [Novosphingobium sp. 11B]